MSVARQHLIDPEVCIRCNTCEETCPVGAITHDDNNYVVNVEKCQFCLDCITPCPTGSIDNWRMVATPYSIQDQFGWDELPEQLELDAAETSEVPPEASEDEATRILKRAHAAESGHSVAPRSAGTPYINLFSRSNPVTARVAGNYRITDRHCESDVRHIVLDFGDRPFPVLEGQSIGIIPPGLDDSDRPHVMRLYSVASPRDGERPGSNNLALTVKRVVFEQDGRTVRGVGSNYVCDLQKGDEVQVTGPFGSTFLMPMDATANLIMICTGTGSAPFRAMTEYRRRHVSNGPGRLQLFFGARTPEELPYFGPLQRLSDSFIDKQLVYSRLQGAPREYVQDRMLKCSAGLAQSLRESQTHVYICGLKGMEQGVDEAFRQICAEHDLDWVKTRSEMQRSGRYHVETY